MGVFLWAPMIRSTIAFWLLLLFTAGGALAENREILQRSDVEVVFPASLRPAAEEILEIYPAVCRDLEETLGWTVRFRPTVVLIKDRGIFRRISGKPGVMALAEPGRNLIVIDFTRMRSHPYTLEGTLKHELCHLILHDRISASGLPLWLDEGLAQWVSGGFTEVAVPQRGNALDNAVISGRLIPLSSLSRAFSQSGRTLVLAYEQSLSLVTYIIERFGVHSLLTLLDRMAEGDSFEEALSKTLSISPGSLESGWRKGLGNRLAWTTMLAGHLYEILFFLASGALIAGFLRLLRKKRTAMKQLEEAEETDTE